MKRTAHSLQRFVNQCPAAAEAAAAAAAAVRKRERETARETEKWSDSRTRRTLSRACMAGVTCRAWDKAHEAKDGSNVVRKAKSNGSGVRRSESGTRLPRHGMH